MRGLFVTATDTGAGKTVLAAAIAAALRARGEHVATFKPVVTGTDEAAHPDWPADDVLLGTVTGRPPEEVAPNRFGPPVSPHLAAAQVGRELDPAVLRAELAAAAAAAQTLVVEGVGGLLVPLAPDYLVRDFACDAGLPIAIAARPGLGTINHTLLTLEAARSAGLTVAAVVLAPWPPQPSA
ncbi:MAG: dethiobiotin synthase, partial [Conexibacter sp.]